MKKFLFGIFLGFIFILSFKLDSFASSRLHFTTYNGVSGTRYDTYDLGANDGFRYCVVSRETGSYQGVTLYSYIFCSSGINSVNGEVHNYLDGNVSTNYVSYNFNGTGLNYSNLVTSTSLGGNNGFSGNIPLFSSYDSANHYLATGDTTGADNVDDLPFDTVGGSSSIPTPVVNWVLNSDGTLSRTLQFTNAQLPQNPNIRMGLQLIVHWASIDNISMSYSNQSASMLSTGYSVFYDNALSQEGVDLGYPLPESFSDFRPCPSEINFITYTPSVNLFNAFLSSHPVSERTISYSPDTISSFANSFRSHLGDIDFEYNVPYVSCRYYYKSADGSDLNYGGWCNTYPKLPSQGAVLSINKTTGEIIVPINDGTVNEGLDTDGNVIFDNGVNIDIPDNVDFSKVNLSLQSIMSVLGEYPSFLAFLFPYLPDWIPQLLGISLGILFVVGLFRIILK